MNELPQFMYHRDPMASGSLRACNDPCECCGSVRGFRYSGVTYARIEPRNLCPWCIADGSAAKKFGASFFDAEFCDDDGNRVVVPEHFHEAVFRRTIGFATFNPFGWWVHCGEPAEYVTRNEPYEMVFECRVCHKQHIVLDLD